VYVGDFDPVDMAHAICAGFNERPVHCTRSNINDFLTDRSVWDIEDYGNPISYDIILYGLVICMVNVAILPYCKMKKQ